MLNFTVGKQDIFEGNPVLGITWSTFHLVSQLISNTLMTAIICYEHFGGDPQKRTILNRLHSFAVGSLLGMSLNQGLVLMIRPVTGLINHQTSFFVFHFPRRFFMFFMGFSVNQLMLLKWLSIVVWKRVPPMNDAFFARFLFVLNFMLSLCLTVIQSSGSDPEMGISYLLSGESPIYFNDEPRFR